MSSTNRGTLRDLDDYYATPPALARLICQRLAADLTEDRGTTTVLEPGCGAGSFLAAARGVWPDAELLGVELSDALAAKARTKGFNVWKADVLDVPLDEGWQVIVGNPPFKHAEAFIHRLAPLLDPEAGFLAFLLRLNFLGGQERFRTLWKMHAPERVYVLPARPGFTPDGKSDSIEYMVAVWRHPSIQTDATLLSYLDNTNIPNKWFPGAYEDPRGLWFPPDEGAGVA